MKIDFDTEFRRLINFTPLRWQSRLYAEYFASGALPAAVDIPTGLGKTAVMAIWYLALKAGARLPRRLVYVVDRRAVVDQATTIADKISERSGDGRLCVSTLRGQHVDAGEWLEDPAAPAIIVGTVDMIGSRLLFSGYGVSRKMRPYHAGFLGSDTLVVLDESHLVPPFEKLLAAIDAGTPAFGPRTEAQQKIVPAFKLLSLSATGRSRNGAVFRLEKEKGDLDDEVVKERLGAKKRLTIEHANGTPLEEALADHAWTLSDKGKKVVRILVYCDSREVAEKTKKAIETFAKGDKKNDVPPAAIYEPELFVGARRVKERVDAEERLRTLGFLAGSNVQLEKPAFLIATSAGEVGIDLDADHMVCDLVPWERMVQRLGRVNRLGKGNAQIVFVHQGEPKPEKPNEPKPKEVRAMIAWRSIELLNNLPKGNGIDVSPGALRELKRRAETDTELQTKIEAATTPPPLYPALTRALVDTWSMTSLEKHSGRPEIAPWLRGWIEDDDPQTTVVWRNYLPVRTGGGEATKKEVEDFFEAAPIHLSEKLETETWRILDWIVKQTVALKKRDPKAKGIVAFVFAPDGESKSYLIEDLVKSGKDKERKDLMKELAGATLIVDARLRGLKDGLLGDDADGGEVRTADDGGDWPVKVGFRIRLAFKDETTDNDARVTHIFSQRRSGEGEDIERLLIISETTEEGRTASTYAQLLEEHQSWAERQARRIAEDVGLTGDNADVLTIASRLHDEGKKARHWQLAFNAPADGIYAKTKGPFVRSRLNGYRHEFGSLHHVERDEGFKRLPGDLKDLVLHLIAAHHGRGRPIIETDGCDDAPPSLNEARARDVALRFARLQKQWGPWGLAWWEALLRAADQQASRENDQKGGAHG